MYSKHPSSRVSSYTPGSFPCQTRDRSGTGEINKCSKGKSYFQFLLVAGLLQHFLLHYAVRLGEAEQSSHLLLFNIWKTPASFLWGFFFLFWEGSWGLKVGGNTRIFEKPQQCFSTLFSFSFLGWFHTHLEMKASKPLTWQYSESLHLPREFSQACHLSGNPLTAAHVCRLHVTYWGDTCIQQEQGRYILGISLCAVPCQQSVSSVLPLSMPTAICLPTLFFPSNN